MNNRYIVIMAGGIGTRFWPLSRDKKPKQFLDILNTGATLLQNTVNRFKGLCPSENIYIATSKDHYNIVLEQVDIPKNNILAEPWRRNTAPCIAYATFRIMQLNPNALIVVSPSDHYIKDEESFKNVINESFSFVSENNALLTLGIKPSSPETGYGYIQANKQKKVKNFENLTRVKTFTEKPNRELAQVFLDSGDFYWNSGVFIWKAKSILEAFEKHLPEIFATFDEYRNDFGTEREEHILGRVYSECRNISIDYGIMEKADNVFVKCAEFGWSDLGTWSSLANHCKPDSNGNTGSLDGVFAYQLENSIINLPNGKIAVLQGLKNYIVVDSDNVLMIIKRDEEQNIKHILDDIDNTKGKDYL